jgi:neutral ceramidase
MPELRASFAQVDITPDRPVSLLGYFTDRRSEGVLDRLHCRIAAFSSGKQRLLFVQIDTCLFTAKDATRLAHAAARASGVPVEGVMVFASHTHTAPALADLYAVKRDADYLDFLESTISFAAARLGPGEPVEVRVCRGRAPGIASNRRWWLANGSVATNPPRMHASLVRPEGPVDDEVNTVVVARPGGAVIGLLVSISNHVDTIGGNLLSADWPATVEEEIRASLGAGPVVIPFLGAAGNINHFDFTRAVDQSSCGEARRIGRAYASAVLASLASGTTAQAVPLAAARRLMRVPGIEVSAEEMKHARDILTKPTAPGKEHDLTAEDIFAGDPAVERIFAEALLDLVRRRPGSYEVPLQLVRLGGIGFFAIPGEPFVEIGIALKALPGFDLAVPVGLANGYFGYIPPKECFGRGGYEVKPGPALLSRDASGMILEAFGEMAGQPQRLNRAEGTGSA